ncbi:MAG: hypothetical protein ACOZAL_00590 [Patescibacteria group bacterium]
MAYYCSKEDVELLIGFGKIIMPSDFNEEDIEPEIKKAQAKIDKKLTQAGNSNVDAEILKDLTAKITAYNIFLILHPQVTSGDLPMIVQKWKSDVDEFFKDLQKEMGSKELMTELTAPWEDML